MKQKTLLIVLLMLLGSLLLACQPQTADVEVVEEAAESVETGSEMAEEESMDEEMAEEASMDEEMVEESDSDEAMAEEDSMDEEVAMEEGGELIYTVAAADSIGGWEQSYGRWH